MNLFLLIVFGVYFALILFLVVAWPEASVSGKVNRFAKITVVVPFRNEETLIGKLIKSLSLLNYPAEQVEMILVNDHSTDRSEEIVAQGITDHPVFTMISLPPGKAGKKQAITYAVEIAKGDIIVTTDSDCHHPINWLSCINSSFDNDQIKMVLGGVKIGEDGSFFSQLQALEFASVIGVGGATAGSGFPVTANGANLAFLKSAFVAVDGFAGNLNIASGDDEFLLRKIAKKFQHSVRFLARSEAIVTTTPQPSIASFFHQRLRWAGKWKHNTSPTARFLGAFVFLFQVSFLLAVTGIITKHLDPGIALSLIAGKIVLEFIFLFRVCSFLQTKFRIAHFFILQFVYPFYVIIVAVGSLFVPQQWRGRTQLS